MRGLSPTQIAMFLMLLIIVGLVAFIIYRELKIENILTRLETAATVEAVDPASVSRQPTAVSNPEPVPKKHDDAIQAIENDTGLTLSVIAKLIIRDEGKRNRPYLDTENKVTIGVGRSLQTNGISVDELHALVDAIDYKVVLSETSVKNGRIYIGSLSLANKIFTEPLTEDDMQLLLVDDLRIVAGQAKGVFPKVWTSLDSVRKEVIVDTVFNLGLPHFKQFVKFIDAVKRQDWESAGNELLKSAAARENPSRFFRNYHVMVTGDPTYFELR